MIQLTSSPNHAGIEITGDQCDLESLYDALQRIVGEEVDSPSLYGAYMRVLGVCYELRKAYMGSREAVFVPNGIHEGSRQQLCLIAPETNVYFKTHVYWPEMLFVMMALNTFVERYAQNLAKETYNLFGDQKVIWDGTIASVRGFQAAFDQCLQETVSSNAYARVRNTLLVRNRPVHRYATQFIDHLNIKYLHMTPDERLKHISRMSKWIGEQSGEYPEIRDSVREAAAAHDTHPENIRLRTEYPHDIQW